MQNFRILFLISFSILLLSACAPAKGYQVAASQSAPVNQGDPALAPTPTPVSAQPTPPPPPVVKMVPLLWEAKRVEGVNWSNYVYSLLSSELHRILDKVQDMEIFCPKFQELTDPQKINAMGMLISGIVKFESNFDPLSRYQETTMGEDPVTGLPVYSEGLMQLSYQDITGWPFCDFDWNADKKLSPMSPQKTILDPFRNLNCGMKILTEQVDRHGKLVIDSGAYWATIKLNGRYEQIQPIAKLVQSLPFCREE